ncbi:MAG: flagellar brake protein [Proteobacteria bacterium]|nr:flagellar brake protein [Pseudomonadota bacterium]HQR03696.1 flagellar brake protein [Rhodocyclaceae bacterium]
MSIPDDKALDQFSTAFRREIVFYLRQLIDNGDQVSVSFNEGRDAVLTILLDVDEEANTLIFDWGGSEESNARLLRSERNIFVAKPQGIRNQFITGRPREVSHKKRRAFAVPLPDKYVRLQRREFFRLVLPMMRRPPCTLKGEKDGNEMTLSVVDIGLGGVGMEVPELAIPCEVAQVFPRARIDLKEAGVLFADLQIRYVDAVTRGTKQFIRIGARFVNASPAQELMLQKFITQVQIEERVRLGA